MIGNKTKILTKQNSHLVVSFHRIAILTHLHKHTEYMSHLLGQDCFWDGNIIHRPLDNEVLPTTGGAFSFTVQMMTKLG